jgi:hypothetical protein
MQKSKLKFEQSEFLIISPNRNNGYEASYENSMQKSLSVILCESNVLTYFLEFLGRSENLLNNSTCSHGHNQLLKKKVERVP